MIDAETGASYGVEVLDEPGYLPGWRVRCGWFPKEPRGPGDGDGLERAKRNADKARADGLEARIVRRDVTIQVVSG